MKEQNSTKKLGMKWYNFFTSVRPCFAFLTLLILFLEIAMYHQTLLSNIWGILYIFGTIVYIILQIKLLFTKETDPNKLFKSIKKVLICEAPYGIYLAIISGFEKTPDIHIATIALSLLFEYFWYTLNIKYFSKRLLSAEVSQPLRSETEVISEDNNMSTSDTNLDIVQNASAEPENIPQQQTSTFTKEFSFKLSVDFKKVSFILGLLLILTLGCTIYFQIQYKKNISELETRIDSLEFDISKLRRKYSYLLDFHD